MHDKPIRWGILGTSPISVTLAEAMLASDEAQLIAIGSRSTDKAARFMKDFHVPKVFNDYEALLADKNIDAVYLGLPNHLHSLFAIKAAQAGKHILCEKPFAVSEAEAHAVSEAAQAANVICMEALMYRYHPFIHTLKDLITQSIIGEITLMTGTYSANIANIANPTASGSIRNLGCYPISLVRLLAGSEPIEINGIGRVCKQTGNDNQASVLLRFANGIMATISTADDLEMFWQFDIYGTKGNIKVITNPWMPNQEHNELIISSNNKSNPQAIAIKADKPLYTYQVDCMNESIKAGKNLGISLADSLGNTHVLETWRKQVIDSQKCSQAA